MVANLDLGECRLLLHRTFVVLMKLVRRMEGGRHVRTEESDVDVQYCCSDVGQSSECLLYLSIM